MTCAQIENALLAVLDARASRDERERVEIHLASCPACAQRLEEMRAVWVALDNLPAVDPSPAFDARVRARLADQHRRLRLLGWLPVPAWATAAVLALALGGFWFAMRPSRSLQVRTAVQSQDDFSAVENLPVLENYDVISNFDALSALPGAQKTVGRQME
jgi:anti-sigma factor RsiW